MIQDVIVIGGSYAGIAASLQLARARRRVLVIDAGNRRNRFASTSHGFLGQDGARPEEVWRTAQDQLLAYPTVGWIAGQAKSASGARDAFAVADSDGNLHEGRRLIFATGVSDGLPLIVGMAERWGRSVFHCPYCHGYELDRGRIGVIATGPMSIHQAQLLPEWGEITFLTNDRTTLDPDQEADLAARGVTVEATPIVAIEGHADVRLADGRLITFAGLFTAPTNAPSTPVAESLGCAHTDTPFGSQISTDGTKETSVRGAYACGDVARMPHSVSLAVADGAWAGAQVHRSLVFPD